MNQRQRVRMPPSPKVFSQKLSACCIDNEDYKKAQLLKTHSQLVKRVHLYRIGPPSGNKCCMKSFSNENFQPSRSRKLLSDMLIFFLNQNLSFGENLRGGTFLKLLDAWEGK